MSRRHVLGYAASGAALVGCQSAGGSAAALPPQDEPFPDLTDQSHTEEPISVAEKLARVERLAGLLREEDLDAFLVEPGATFRYLTDVSWGNSERLFALIVLADGSSFWICPAFEAPRAAERIAASGFDGPIVTWDEHEYAWRPLAAALTERRVERMAIDPRARAFVVQSIQDEWGAERIAAGTALVRRLRGRKDAHELRLMRRANELTKQAIVRVSEELEAGVTDRDLGRLIRTAQERLGLRGVWVLPLLGEGAAFPHGSPDGTRLARGDTILVDTGGSLHGYQSDITRTWVFDAAPSDEVARGWRSVRDAQRRAFEAIAPGKRCRDIDAVARAAIEEAGYGAGYESFAHRLGHGIGMEGHEEPYFDGGSDVVLEPGMTFSDEPGIYLPGRFGIRIEDIVVVTETGADVFGAWQAGPESPAS